MTRARLIRWRVLTRGWRLTGALTGIAVTSAVLTLVPRLVPLPQMLVPDTFNGLSLTFGSLIVALMVLHTADEPVDQLGATAAVRLPAVRMLRVTLVTALAIAAVSAADPAHLPAGAVTVVTFVGEGLLVARVAGPGLAWLLPSAHLLAAVTFGVTTMRQVAGWAWILDARPSLPGLLAASTLYASGLVLWARHFPLTDSET